MPHPAGQTQRFILFRPRTQLVLSITSGVLLLLGFIADRALRSDAPSSGQAPGQAFGQWLIWISLALGLIYGLEAAWASLRKLVFDIDVLMSVGALLAAYVGHPEEGALLLFLFGFAGALEDLAMLRTEREIASLHALMPQDALVWRTNDWTSAPAETLITGDRIKIRPGERVPADATVVTGRSSLDQSAITGESLPRDVGPGDELFAGTINTDDALEAAVLRPVAESSLAKILELVTTAKERRLPVQRFIDRISQPYALGVLATSTIVALIWWRVFKEPLVGTEDAPGALYTAITFLIIASPCAIIIATPVATLAAIARAARSGVLVKGGEAFSRLAGIGAMCFDKTGTLTHGRPHLYEAHPVAWSDGPKLLALAAALEADSTHPIAHAIREAARERSLPAITIDDINHTTAAGLEGRFQSHKVRLGRYSFTEPVIPTCLRNRVKDILDKVRDRGHVAVVIALAGREAAAEGPQVSQAAAEGPSIGEAAVLIMADSVRPGAERLVADLHALNIRPVRMLTGDNAVTAARVAQSLNLDGFDADLQPADKQRILGTLRRQLARDGRPRRGVAHIGDGINDAPALASADVAIGMGNIGTAAALESSDVVLLTDDLSTIPWTIRLARRTSRTITFNLIFAMSIIAIMATLTLVGSRTGHTIPLSLAVLAHEGGTVVVVLVSLLILRFPSPTPKPTRTISRA